MHGVSEKTDAELVVATLEDADVFLHLMRRYEGKLTAYIRRLSGFSLEDAEDVLQDVFLSTYNNLNGFKPSLKFSSWIYRIAHNQTMSALRKRKSRPVFFYTEEDLIYIADTIEFDEGADQAVQKDEIDRALRTLDTKYKEVLVLKFIEGRDYEEIADILQIPIGTVGTRINRAKKKCKDMLQSTYGSRN